MYDYIDPRTLLLTSEDLKKSQANWTSGISTRLCAKSHGYRTFCRSTRRRVRSQKACLPTYRHHSQASTSMLRGVSDADMWQARKNVEALEQQRDAASRFFSPGPWHRGQHPPSHWRGASQGRAHVGASPRKCPCWDMAASSFEPRSAFVPMNVPLCAFMLMASSTPQVLAAQWSNPQVTQVQCQCLRVNSCSDSQAQPDVQRAKQLCQQSRRNSALPVPARERYGKAVLVPVERIPPDLKMDCCVVMHGCSVLFSLCTILLVLWLKPSE